MADVTSESVRGLPSQPGPLCYHIDFGVIPAILSDENDAALRNLEVLRSEIIALRKWGEAWKQYALDYLPHQ